MLSGKGLCDGPITRPEESFRVWCVAVFDPVKNKPRIPAAALAEEVRLEEIIFKRNFLAKGLKFFLIFSSVTRFCDSFFFYRFIVGYKITLFS